MQRDLYPSLEAMLAPASLSHLEGRPVHDVRWHPLDSVDGFSGSEVLLMETNGGQGRRYVLKRIREEWDWIMRATNDTRGRPVLAWQTGLLDRLPQSIAHGVVACALDRPGWAVLMQDFSGRLVPSGDSPIGEPDNDLILQAMAEMGAAFWERVELADPQLGFCSLDQYYALLTLGTARREAEAATPIPRMILDGWGLLEGLLERDVFDVALAACEQPQRLCDALEHYPQTVAHGDWKLGNLGVLAGPPAQVVLLDWALIGPKPACADLGWYLAVNSARLPVSKESAIATYRLALESHLGTRFDQAWWEPQLELCLLGAFVQLGWAKALGAARSESEAVRDRERAELVWWSRHVRAATAWL